MTAPPKSLLDTDTVSLFNPRHPTVQRNAKVYLDAHHVLSFSEVTRYEIVRGMLAAGASSRLTLFARFCEAAEIVPVDWTVLERAAQIWSALRQRGRMIEETDILIAASALCQGWALVTHNTRHFQHVAGLTLIDWMEPNP